MEATNDPIVVDDQNHPQDQTVVKVIEDPTAAGDQSHRRDQTVDQDRDQDPDPDPNHDPDHANVPLLHDLEVVLVPEVVLVVAVLN